MTKKSNSVLLDVDQKRAEKMVTQMMSIPGKSCEEAAIAKYIVNELKHAGVSGSAILHDQAHRNSPYGGQVGNLIVKLPGTLRRPRRLLMSHMDTVPLCVGSRPVRRGRRIVSSDSTTALGADNRSGSAVILLALQEILRQKIPHPPLTFLWCVQEELGLVGSRHLSVKKLSNPKLAFNFDGGAPEELVIGATGAIRMTIHIQGIASHAGVHPERGASAITIAALAIASLQKDGWHGRIQKGKKRGTSNVGVIEAGQATNVITESAKIRAEIRSHSPDFRKRILEKFKKTFKNAAKQVRNDSGRSGSVRFEISPDYESFVLRKGEPCVEMARAAIRAVGKTPVYRIVDGGLDANWMHVHGVPTVSLGAGQREIHTVKESLHLDEFFVACGIGLRLALQ